MAEVAVIGAGAFGRALAHLLEKNGHSVCLCGHDGDLKSAMQNKDLLVLAVASVYVRGMAGQMATYLKDGQLIVNVAKGIEDRTYLSLSAVLSEVLPTADTVVLSGPSHAEEVIRDMPTAVVCASADRRAAERVQEIFMSPVFRVYTSPDVLGVEMGGALKNVIALAAGMADGMGYGDNCKAALITRGIREISTLALRMGAYEETLNGLTGIGDLIVTCASQHSRNRRAGFLIGQGYTPEEAIAEVKEVVEGFYSAKAALHLGRKYDVELPIIEQVNEVLFHKKDPRQAVGDLMLRDRKSESSKIPW